MKSEVTGKKKERGDTLAAVLDNASSIITKDYLAKLQDFDIIKPSEEDVDIDIAECGKFYRLTKLVIDREESFLDKLITVVNVVSSIGASLVTAIKSDGARIDYYFGIVSKNARDSREKSVRRRQADKEAFRGAVAGNLIGSEMEELSGEEAARLRECITGEKESFYASISGIAAIRDRDGKKAAGFVRGIENLVDSLKGQKYMVIMIADPVDTAQLGVVRQGYELLHSQLSAFSRSAVTWNESDTLSLSRSRTEGFSEGITTGIAMTQSRSRSKGRSFGGGFSASAGIPGILQAGVNMNAEINTGTSETEGQSRNQSESRQRSQSVADTQGSSKTAGRSLQLYYENRSIKSLMERIDRNLKRLDECESFGAFDCAAYVVADARETALSVAGNYNALMRGSGSNVQASHINVWYRPEDAKRIAAYLGSLVHPRFWQDEDSRIAVTPASIISGSELALQIGLPQKSISGVTVIPMASFGRNAAGAGEGRIELGSLYHMGHEEGGRDHKQRVGIDIQSLAMHTFITGSTGAGKTTAVCSILDKLAAQTVKGGREKIRFLVIEPAKGEYKDRYGSDGDVSVYGTNEKKMPLLKINPFSFPEDVHVLEHIDRLVEIFNVCWPMYAAMPAVLKDAMERAYLVSGWDLETSECRYKDSEGKSLFPSFLDVLAQVNAVMDESLYSSDSKGDYKGALCTRLKSLTNGLYGRIFTCDELEGEALFDRNVIVDLSRVGSSETKSLIMGLLVMKLQEYRMAGASGGNAPLKHITVLEEAHHILKRTNTEQSGEGANLIGKSVEMLANSIAEMRTYGEGFLIADQAPGLMDLSVIRNTNTKIILRLPDYEDRRLVGMAANLNENQILELSRLKTFVAAVYQNDWLEPVLCRIDTDFKDLPPYRYHYGEPSSAGKQAVAEFLCATSDRRQELDEKYIERLEDFVFRLALPAEAKIAFLQFARTSDKREAAKLRGQVLYSVFNSETAFYLAKGDEKDFESWYKKFTGALDPAIGLFHETVQRKVIAILTRERAERERNAESAALFERLRNYL